MARHVQRYRVSVAIAVLLGAAGIWPTLIAPIWRMYVSLCARYLTSTPVEHLLPPLHVVLLAPLLMVVVGSALLTLVRQAWRQHRLELVAARRHAVAEPRVQCLIHHLGLSRRVHLTNDAAVYTFCAGLIRPHVYLSRGLLDLLTIEELEAVLRHERHHVARRDPLRFFLAGFLVQLAPVFPVLTAVAERIRIRAELAADRAALRHVPVETLARALVKVMRASAPPVYHGASAALSPTEARVAALVGRQVAARYDRGDVTVSLGMAVIAVTVLVWLHMQPLPLPATCTPCPPF